MSLNEHLGEQLRAAVEQHKDDPPLLSGFAPTDTAVVNTLPLPEARDQWKKLATIGVLPVSVEPGENTTVVYAVPSGARLS